MSLWADKYKPKNLDQLSYHKDLSTHLKKLVRHAIVETSKKTHRDLEHF